MCETPVHDAMATKEVIRWGILGVGDVCEIKSGPGFQKAVGGLSITLPLSKMPPLALPPISVGHGDCRRGCYDVYCHFGMCMHLDVA